MTDEAVRSSPEKRSGLWLQVLLGVVLVGVLAAAGTGLLIHAYLTSPGPEIPGETILVIDPGDSFDAVVDRLYEHGVIRGRWKFKALGRLTNKAHRIKAGEILVDSAWPPPRILEALISGKPYLHRLQIPEGLTWWQIATIVEDSGLAGFESFSQAVRDRDMLERWSIPADTAEGFLFPETYYLPRPPQGDAKPVVEAMLNMFWEQTRDLWPEEKPDPDTLMKTVILGSLVEKESALPEERPVVAGVYTNRLERGMRLQADPTIIYGLGSCFDGNLKRSHLTDSTNPYNTYMHSGLPPGPICSPGLAALKAAALPARHNLLYFVSRGDGSHQFSRTLSEHNRAVRTYQLRK